jgi:hypothetical protein
MFVNTQIEARRTAADDLHAELHFQSLPLPSCYPTFLLGYHTIVWGGNGAEVCAMVRRDLSLDLDIAGSYQSSPPLFLIGRKSVSGHFWRSIALSYLLALGARAGSGAAVLGDRAS